MVNWKIQLQLRIQENKNNSEIFAQSKEVFSVS